MCMYKSPAVSFVCRVLDEVLQKLVHLVQEEECVSVSQAHIHMNITLCFLYAPFCFQTHAEYKSFLTVGCVYYSTSDSSILPSLSLFLSF